MSNWSRKPSVIEPFQFDGDTIHATVHRLTIKEMSGLVGQKFDLTTQSGQLAITEVGAALLPTKLASFEGLKDAEGLPVSMQDYLDNIHELYLAPITGTLLNGLIVVSSVKANEKNSAPPSLDSSGIASPQASSSSAE